MSTSSGTDNAGKIADTGAGMSTGTFAGVGGAGCGNASSADVGRQGDTLSVLLAQRALATRPDPLSDTVRFACVAAYDGLCFHGWMKQKGETLTVQGCLEQRLQSLLRRDVWVVAHGRTDAGVHSAGTVFHFDITRAEATRLAGLMQRKCAGSIGSGSGSTGSSGSGGGGFESDPTGGFEAGLRAAAQCLLNAFKGTTPLPDQLYVLTCDAVSARFHARRSSCGKEYHYRVGEARPHPLAARGMHVLTGGCKALDLDAMQKAAAALLGEGVRDWSFLAHKSELSGDWEPERCKVRRLFKLEVVREGAVVTIRIAGDFFLWNMCRRIAGLLVSVGQGRCSAEEVTDPARCPLVTMPAKGLMLQEVWYADDGVGLDPNAEGFI